jgi:hypothetical protein
MSTRISKPLESIGQHQRSQWFKCACCPPNVARFLASLGGYVYGVEDDRIYVNLYAGNEALLNVGDHEIRLTQTTRYPWKGEVEFTLDLEQAAEFSLALRIPVWATGSPVHLDIYQYLEIKDLRPKLSVNGEPVDLEMEDSYAIIDRHWQGGDTVTLELPMDVRRVLTHHKVAAHRGPVALERGPVVYCLESVDNGGELQDIELPVNTAVSAEPRPDLLGGVTVIQAQGLRSDTPTVLTFVPYYAWAHRGAGQMKVWVPVEK